ncbi:hybrid sensor histidine kinase/response regulator [Aureisphaera sp. CAU 1614]|uniref:histidine kinase n=1 Tax=Halomarinibacterium sedimenti TaxID=2857106 RepID=A0A9X1FPM5_9FLAO|nr:hybrid sensor histidine kinase/response regulator [Halomarinibacterium sedimenti]MBW2938488.1 hybrid sensor histidine kinase/response regulator [Halomarinibacterium sedimenti]
MAYGNLKKQLFESRVQEIEISQKGEVISSDNAIFNIAEKSNISNFHLFFELFPEVLTSINENIQFPCINIEFEGVKKIIDVEVIKKEKRFFLFFFDLTEHYENSQPIVQEKNEASIAKNKLDFEKKLLEAKEEFKNTFLANLNHEIRNPLNNLLGFLETLSASSLSYEQTELLKVAQKTGLQLKVLMEDLLDISKIEDGVLELKHVNFNLSTFMAAIYKHFQHKYSSDIHFTVETESKVHTALIGDPNRLHQILFNLIENAFQNTYRGSVSLSVVPSPNNQHIKSSNETVIRFIIKDTGKGIAQEKISKVFDNYLQLEKEKLKPLGDGLGLKIVKNLVQLMNGTVAVESKIDVGTEFILDIPFTTRIPKKKAYKTKKIPGIYINKNILVIEDIKDNQMLFFKHFLNNDEAYVMHLATDGAMAFSLLEKKRIDVIIAKTTIPDIDIFSFIDKVKEHPEDSINKTPIIVASGNSLLEFQNTLEEKEISNYLMKPFTKKELFKAIKESLNQ